MKLDLNFVNRDRCGKAYKKEMSPRLFCAGGNENFDTCDGKYCARQHCQIALTLINFVTIGDSGGPMMMKQHTSEHIKYWLLVGVISGGQLECATRSIPGFYTRVGQYMDWILLNM